MYSVMFVREITRVMTRNKEREGKMDGRKENRREEGINLVRKAKLDKEQI